MLLLLAFNNSLNEKSWNFNLLELLIYWDIDNKSNNKSDMFMGKPKVQYRPENLKFTLFKGCCKGVQALSIK